MLAKSLVDPNLPLLWTNKIKYLGIYISSSSSNYYTLNLAPLIQTMKNILRAWVQLPLSLIRGINVFKMKLLPVFLYVLRHSPVWIPKRVFCLIYTTLTSFLWGQGQPRFKLMLLQRPWWKEIWLVLTSIIISWLLCCCTHIIGKFPMSPIRLWCWRQPAWVLTRHCRT